MFTCDIVSFCFVLKTTWENRCQEFCGRPGTLVAVIMI